MSLTGKPQLTTNAPLANDGFWPDLVVGEFVEKYRVPGEYDDGVISWGLALGVVRINEKLKAAKQEATSPADPSAIPYTTLKAYAEAVKPDRVDDELVLVRWYKHAAYCSAKAFCLQQFNTMNRRKDAENAAKEAPETEEYWLDQAQKSMHKLMGVMKPDEAIDADYNIHVVLI